MSLTLTKRYAFDFEPGTDLIVVLRRYDEHTHPWGVHRITLDHMAEQFITSRPIGLFTDDEVMQIAARQQVLPYYLQMDEPFVMVANQVHGLLHRYIWTQVVPMEWHGQYDELHGRVIVLSTPDSLEWEGVMDDLALGGADPFWDLREFVDSRWDLETYLAAKRAERAAWSAQLAGAQ